MGDLIPRDLAMRALASSNGDFLLAMEKLENIPSVDAVPVEWLRKWAKTLREGAYVHDIIRDWQKVEKDG